MSNKWGEKNSTKTDDFEAFFRESLVNLSEGQGRIMILQDVAGLKEKSNLTSRPWTTSQ